MQTLEPLAYHRTVADYIQHAEPEIWRWAAAQQTREEQVAEMRIALLRQTYRLDAEAHPDVHEDCRVVMGILGIEAPVTIYQAADGTMNAALWYIPGEIHLVFYGPVLEKLSRAERVALIGHELAHYKLWSIEDGAFHIATTILDHALAYPGAAASHAETARIYRLYTELYADRGGAIAADVPGPAIATLVKTMTGIVTVDADAYLRQAAELDGDQRASAGETHPEIFLRAQALDKWWRGDPDLDEWLDKRVRGALSITALDLPRQHDMVALTRGYLARLATDPAADSEAVAAQLKRYFPDWGPDEMMIGDYALEPERLDTETRDYLFALSFDLAMADPDGRDAMLIAGERLARSFDGGDAFRAALKRDLKMNKQSIDKLLGRKAAA
ncbi:MAG: M48 family metalloprotease [Sphingomonas sp.]